MLQGCVWMRSLPKMCQQSSDTAKKSNTTFEILETCCNLMQGLQNCDRIYGSAVTFKDFLREIIKI